jgi:hypothetical protein
MHKIEFSKDVHKLLGKQANIGYVFEKYNSLTPFNKKRLLRFYNVMVQRVIQKNKCKPQFMTFEEVQKNIHYHPFFAVCFVYLFA